MNNVSLGPDPRAMDEQAFRSWNDVMARNNNPDDFHRKSTGLVRWINQKRVEWVLRLVAAEKHDRVLEIGCGAGNILAQIDSDDRTGIDLCDDLLKKARCNCGQSVRLLQGNAERLPFADQSFDRVYCTEVFEHLQRPAEAVAEMARVLRPGGRAVISLPNDRTIGFAKRVLRGVGLFGFLLGTRQKDNFEPHDENAWHIHSLTLQGMRSLCADRFRELRAAFIPCRLFPIQYVVSFERKL